MKLLSFKIFFLNYDESHIQLYVQNFDLWFIIFVIDKKHYFNWQITYIIQYFVGVHLNDQLRCIKW